MEQRELQPLYLPKHHRNSTGHTEAQAPNAKDCGQLGLDLKVAPLQKPLKCSPGFLSAGISQTQYNQLVIPIKHEQQNSEIRLA